VSFPSPARARSFSSSLGRGRVASALVLSALLSSRNLRAEAAGVCGAFPPANVQYRFGTGSRPAAPPALAEDGRAYVGTSEGYLHALDANGGYLWGYTLRGPVTGRPIVGISGAVLVPTRRRIYAIRPDGTLLWVFDSPVAVLGDLIRDSLGRYNFASEDGRIFALSGQGALVAHVPMKGTPSVLPVSVLGAVAVAYESGTAILVRPGKTKRFELSASPHALLPCPDAELCAIVGGSLRPLGAEPPPWQTRALRAAGNSQMIAFLPDDRHLTAQSSGGVARFTLELPGPASAAPAVSEDGRVFVPLKGGELALVSARGELVACAPLASSPLGTPVLDPAHHRVLATAVEGVLGAVELE
jgi:hypothetical protein